MRCLINLSSTFYCFRKDVTSIFIGNSSYISNTTTWSSAKNMVLHQQQSPLPAPSPSCTGITKVLLIPFCSMWSLKQLMGGGSS